MDDLKFQKVIRSIIVSPIHSQFGKFQFIKNLENNNGSFNIKFTFLDRLTNTNNLLLNLKSYVKDYFFILKKSRSVDIVHIVCFFSKVRLLLDLLFILSFRKKVIYDFHGDFLVNFRSSGKFIRWIYLLNVRLSSGVICLNRGSYLLLKRKTKNITQLFNWIEIPESHIRKCEKKYDIVFHGRVTFDKGYRIFEQLARANPSWRILLIGPISPKNHESLPNNIEHVAAIQDKSILYGKLLEGRVYVFPSIREGIAFSLLEAMALGLPVVASDICSNRFLLRRNKQYLIKARNYEDYQNALNVLLDDEELRVEVGKANEQFLRLTLSKEKYFESLYRLYSLVNESFKNSNAESAIANAERDGVRRVIGSA